MIKKKLFSALIGAGLSTIGANAGIVLNEVMQSNVYCIMDDINEFPDSWVELYNDGDAVVDIKGYGLGLKTDVAKAYIIPTSTMLLPKQYILIYCDKVGEGLHTDFRIDSGKGNLYLFDPDGNKIDEVSMKKMPAPDVAYGRKTDAASKWAYMLTATPGKSNNDAGTSDIILDEVKFSEPGGVWANKRHINVTLSLPDNAPDGAYIIYTTNGSEPTLANSTKYSNQVKVTSSMVLRAKAVCEGAISRPSNAESYIFLGREPKIPVISIGVNDEYINDYNIGILADGPGGYNNENYRHDWRRPINIQYFEAGEGAPCGFNQLAETRVQGGYTRSNALKSLAVYANKRFGTKRFDYELWAKDKPGVTDNKSFILRNGGNDFTWCYVRDGLMQRIIGRNTNIDWQGYSPAIVMINGKYHAMLAIRERSNEDNVYSNYDGLEDIDMVENWGEDIKAGDREALDYLLDFIYQEHTWDEWAEVINLESYTNLMALNYWIYNTDFPHNNIMMWRRTDGVDGRWQWLVKDCDFGLGIWNSEDNLYKNYHDYLYTNSTWSPGFDIYQRLMQNLDFRAYYVDHLVAYMGDFLNETTFINYLDEIWEENQGEQAISHDIWAAMGWWKPDLNNNLNFMRSWISKRERTMSNLMKKSWGLGNVMNVKVNNELSDEELADLSITYTASDVHLTQGRFDGNDYVGRTLVVKASDDDCVTGWRVRVGGNESEVEGKEVTMAINSTAQITVNAILGGASIGNIAIEKSQSISAEGATVSGKGDLVAYDLAGRAVARGINTLTLPARGIYVVKSTDGSSAKVVY